MKVHGRHLSQTQKYLESHICISHKKIESDRPREGIHYKVHVKKCTVRMNTLLHNIIYSAAAGSADFKVRHDVLC